MTPLRRLAAVCLAALLCAPAAAFAAPGDPFEHLYFSGDELVESATRSPKPLSQVAENVAVVTAAEIRDMNAHTLAEVLYRVSGVFVQFFGVHPGATALPHIQGSGETNPFRRGSEERHVTVLVDGMPWSSQTSGALLDTIPVGIIDRIEVVKGPASSAWGSSLGGVVNVITKQPGRTPVPSGAVQGSYGERGAYDVRGEAAGAAGPLGYFVQGQVQSFDWDDAGADFRSRSAFAKASARLAPTAALTLSGGYANRDLDNGHLASQFAFAQQDDRAAYGRAALDLAPDGPVSIHLSAYRLHQDMDQPSQEDGTFAPPGDLLRDVRLEERTTGTQVRAVWAGRGHTAVVGADWARTSVEHRTESGDFFQSLGAPPTFEVSPAIRRWGAYANDTLLLGTVTVIPGVRYDDSDLTDPFWSPSLGVTWQAASHTLLRAAVARGFAIPPLAYLEGGGVGLDPNPDLDPEKIWSYQLGAETTALGPLWLKLALFRHEVSHALVLVPSPGPGDAVYVNQGTIWRTGFEAEAETASFHGLRLRGGVAHVRVERSGEDRDQDQHQAKLGLYYDRGTFHAQLFGHYVWWDLGPGAEEGRHNDCLWDLNARKGFGEGLVRAEVFAALRNVFSGDQSFDVDRGTAGRWVEGGVRVLF